MVTCTSGISDSSEGSLRGVAKSSTARSSDIADSSVFWMCGLAESSLACGSVVGDSVEGSPGGDGDSGNVPGM